ncbi:MAG: hypothetical protein CMN56_13830 [Sneathiella sp.]|nr:hypothetical protein [Sneathiella sp.]
MLLLLVLFPVWLQVQEQFYRDLWQLLELLCREQQLLILLCWLEVLLVVQVLGLLLFLLWEV